MTQKKRDLIQKACFSCGSKCCKSTLVPDPFLLALNPGDFSDLMNHQYTICLGFSSIKDTPTFVMKSHIFGYCIFLDYEMRHCKIYDHRPRVCRGFPFNPVGRSGLIEYCLLYKKVKEKHPLKIKNTEEREKKKFESTKNIAKIVELSELDRKYLRENYSPYVEKYLDKETEIHNEWGSFVVKESLHRKIEIIHLFKLIEAYSKVFQKKTPFINILIVDKGYAPIFLVHGVFRSKTKYSFKQMEDLYDKKNHSYYNNEFDGSLLEGLVFYDELFRDYSTWTPVWVEMKHAMELFRKRKESF